MGCARFRLWGERSKGYVAMPSTASNKGWHDEWFYLKNDSRAPVPEFTGRLFLEKDYTWDHGASKGKEVNQTLALIPTVRLLAERGVTGVGVIAEYHRRRVLPLMARSVPLQAMTPDAPTVGVVMVVGGLSDGEVFQCLKDALATISLSIRPKGIPRCGQSMDSLMW